MAHALLPVARTAVTVTMDSPPPGLRLSERPYNVRTAAPMITKTTVAQPADGGSSGEGERLGLLVMSAESFASLPLPRTGVITVGRSTKCDVQIDDPLVSRQHVRLHLGPTVEIEDLGSANRTRVRDVPIPPGGRVPVAPGEAVGLGSTVLVIQGSYRDGAPRRIWSHRFFEARLREECSRPEAKRRPFALVRLHLDQPRPWSAVLTRGMKRCL